MDTDSVTKHAIMWFVFVLLRDAARTCADDAKSSFVIDVTYPKRLLWDFEGFESMEAIAWEKECVVKLEPGLFGSIGGDMGLEEKAKMAM